MKIRLLLSLLTVLTASGAGYAQEAADGFKTPFELKNGSVPTTPVSWEMRLASARVRLLTVRDYTDNPKEQASVEQEYRGALLEAVGVRDKTAIVAGYILTAKNDLTQSEANSFSIMQQQRLIEQNAEIIALLKAQAIKK